MKNQFNEQPMLLTMPQFAEMAGLAYCHVRKLTMEGKLPYVPVGKTKRIPVKAGLEAVKKLIVTGGTAV